MENVDDDTLFETLVLKIMQRFAVGLEEKEQGLPRGVLKRIEHLQMASMVAESCQNEKIMKSKIKFIAIQFKNILCRTYLPFIDQSEQPLTFINSFNRCLRTLVQHRKFLTNFFKFYDSKPVQKYLFLDCGLGQCLEDVTFDILIQPKIGQIMETISAFILSFQIEKPGNPEFVYFLTMVYYHINKRHRETIAKILNETIILRSCEEKLENEIKKLTREDFSAIYLQKVTILKRHISGFFNFHFSIPELKATLLPQLQSILGHKLLSVSFIPFSQSEFLYAAILHSDIANLRDLWEISCEPENVLLKFRHVFLNFIIEKSFQIITENSQISRPITNNLLTFLNAVRNSIVNFLENHKLMRSAKNKAFEEIMNEQNFNARNRNFDSFCKELFCFLKNQVSIRAIDDPLVDILLELLGYINPSYFKNNMDDFLLNLVVKSTAKDEAFQAYIRLVLNIFSAKLGEDAVQPALGVLNDIEYEDFGVSDGGTRLKLTSYHRIEGIYPLTFNDIPIIQFFIERLRPSLGDKDKKNLKTYELDYESGEMEIQLNLNNQEIQFIATPAVCIILITILQNDEMNIDILCAFLLSKNEDCKQNQKQIAKVQQILLLLVNNDLIKKEGNLYSINNNFKSDKNVIIISDIGKLNVSETGPVEETSGRNVKTESQIMRIIKSNPNIQLSALYEHLNVGAPGLQEDHIRSSIEHLVKNDYIEIVDTNPIKFAIK